MTTDEALDVRWHGHARPVSLRGEHDAHAKASEDVRRVPCA